MSDELELNINDLNKKFKSNIFESIAKIENLVITLEKISDDKSIQDSNVEIITNLNGVADELRRYLSSSEEE
tara:strand:+ start:932 stop:1147 length:216 start_codon:yes stop_codon:yes gene_type:complete